MQDSIDRLQLFVGAVEVSVGSPEPIFASLLAQDCTGALVAVKRSYDQDIKLPSMEYSMVVGRVMRRPGSYRPYPAAGLDLGLVARKG